MPSTNNNRLRVLSLDELMGSLVNLYNNNDKPELHVDIKPVYVFLSIDRQAFHDYRLKFEEKYRIMEETGVEPLIKPFTKTLHDFGADLIANLRKLSNDGIVKLFELEPGNWQFIIETIINNDLHDERLVWIDSSDESIPKQSRLLDHDVSMTAADTKPTYQTDIVIEVVENVTERNLAMQCVHVKPNQGPSKLDWPAIKHFIMQQQLHDYGHISYVTAL